MPGDDITNAELARRLDSMHRDVHEDLAELKRRQDLYLLREVYSADQRNQETRMTALEQAMQRSNDSAAAYRRMVIGAVVTAVLALVVQLVLSMRGPV